MSDVIVVALITAGVGFATTLINKFCDRRRLTSAIDKIAEGLAIGLENDAVIFKALRENEINGESEVQERKMNEYFRDSTTSGFCRRK